MNLLLRLNIISLLSVVLVTTAHAQAPVIASFSPASGAPGTLVTINGTNLGNQPSLTLGGKAALLISIGTTKLTGMVMPGATTGGVTVTTTGGTNSAVDNFTVTATQYPAVYQSLMYGSSATNSFPGQVGQETAISADGNTVVTAGSEGRLWVFVRSGSTWTQQSDDLTSSPFKSYPKLSISADGNTIACAAGYVNTVNVPVALIFSRSGGTWVKAAEIPVAQSSRVSRVSLSGDGNTVAIGGTGLDAAGGAWIVKRSGTNWIQQGNKLTGTGNIGYADFGSSLALSADANTLAVGGIADDSNRGALWVFINNGGSWTQEGSKLIATGSAGTPPELGTAVAISADGNTIITGGKRDNTNVGAAWVFSRSGGIWTQQGNKLLGSGNIGSSTQGEAVGLTADGNTAVIGGPTDSLNHGAIWVFTRTGGSWSQKGNKIIGQGYAQTRAGGPIQGSSIVVSADGTTTAWGGPNNSSGFGALWVYISTKSPIFFNVTPIIAKSGTVVTITGDNFTGTTAVTFGGVPAASFTVVSATTIQATPGGSSLNGDISVVTPGGTATFTGFKFVPSLAISAAGPTTFLTGGSVALTTANLTGYSYQWTKDGSPISNAATSSYSATETGSYRVSISLNGVQEISPPVAVTAVFGLPSTNFTFTYTAATCRESANASISIAAAKSLSYTVVLTGASGTSSYTFTNNLDILNLPAGNYNVCITVAGQPAYQQCFTAVITEPKDLTAYVAVIKGTDKATLTMSGATEYIVNLNGAVFTSATNEITLALEKGLNTIIVSTGKTCQTAVTRRIFIGENKGVYPNPVERIGYVNPGVDQVKKAVINVFNMNGGIVYTKNYANYSGDMDFNLVSLSPGLYVLKLVADGNETIYRIVKK